MRLKVFGHDYDLVWRQATETTRRHVQKHYCNRPEAWHELVDEGAATSLLEAMHTLEQNGATTESLPTAIEPRMQCMRLLDQQSQPYIDRSLEAGSNAASQALYVRSRDDDTIHMVGPSAVVLVTYRDGNRLDTATAYRVTEARKSSTKSAFYAAVSRLIGKASNRLDDIGRGLQQQAAALSLGTGRRQRQRRLARRAR